MRAENYTLLTFSATGPVIIALHDTPRGGITVCATSPKEGKFADQMDVRFLMAL